MNKRPNHSLVAAAFAVLSIAPPVAVMDRDAEPATTTPPAETVPTAARSENKPSIRLTLVQQQQSGLRTARLTALKLQPETLAYGRVVDIQPLLELRARYRAAKSDALIAAAALRVARKNYQRLASLHRESIIATRDLIQAESQLAAENARAATSTRHVHEIREEALQWWGSELFQQVVEEDSPLLDKLLTRQQALLLIALPANRSLPVNTLLARFAPTGNRQDAQEARLVSSAPRTDDTVQGETWFFAAENRNLRTGMRLDAWIPQAGVATSGVAIPLSAVVWFNGKPWVYLKVDAQTFSRHSVTEHVDYGDAWFVGQGFRAGDEVVVTGGQLLLSEEFRRQIPAEGDD